MYICVAYIQRDRDKHRQTDKQTNKQTNKQTGRQTHTERDKDEVVVVTAGTAAAR